ncbi:hypothetical protein [Luteimonas sp. R10]|uniref:hypothetical protein n=1 Tax=Luteimonas sp. R10 TaxID=3108176 RepID=UPI0030898389|nr:hypothetical protein U3649_13385 [Luteimonas sp. R10]
MSNESEAPEPVKKLVYPFPIVEASSGDERNTAEATDPQAYYDALALAEDGFYPIGYNGQWHGGIHFGSQTGTQLAQDAGIRCIADGEVIAWKIDDDYPAVEYASCGPATYATGFTLVRHRLQLPKAANGQAGDGATDGNATDQNDTDAQEEPSLLFYSLYIHLLSWKGYKQSPDKPRPAYWGDPLHIVGEKARDANRANNPHIPENGIGLNLRDANRRIVGFAPRGTRLKLGARLGTTGYYAVTEVVGAVYPEGLTGAHAYKAEIPDTEVEPGELDTIVIPDEPVKVKAGDLIGHLGQYQRYIDMNPLGSACNERPLMQVEVFTLDDIDAFISQSRARAAQLEERHKTLLLIEEGARLVQTTGTAAPDAAQLSTQADGAEGPVAGHTRVLPISALDEPVKEEDGTRWWRVEVGTAEGSSASGWVREKEHAKVRLCTPWDWPGFEIVNIDGATPRALYAHHVVQQGHAAPDEQGQLEAEGSSVDSGVLFRKLYDVIDLDGDKALTPLELRQALRKPWLAQALAHLIIKHESEWSGPMDKWHAMDDLIPDQRKPDWEKEKARIESLLWWDKVKGNQGLPESESLVAFNLHPVGFITNFATGPCYCHRDLTEEELREIILAMRRSETAVHGAVGERLFTATNISMPDGDKNYRMLAEEINAVFNQFEINTCIRRIHFLAQAYWEADRLRTTKEYGTGHRYAPYVGRGLMQLTWESGYQKYESYSGLGCVDDPDLVSNSLNHSVLSAAWYWNQGKELSVGTTWSAPASAPEYVRRHNPSYPKRTITYTYGGRQSSYGTIDLNLVADDDYVDVISWLVNGGSNGLTERRVYVTRLKEIMNYDSSCISRRE